MCELKTKGMRLRQKQRHIMKKKNVQTLMKEANNVSLKICNDDKRVCFWTGELPPILSSFS